MKLKESMKYLSGLFSIILMIVSILGVSTSSVIAQEGVDPGTVSYPIATTLEADVTGCTTATLNGYLLSRGGDASCNVTFVWGTSLSSLTNETPVEIKNTTGIFSYPLTGLTAGTTYYFKARAKNSRGTWTSIFGKEFISTPTVDTEKADGIDCTKATLKGELKDMGYQGWSSAAGDASNRPISSCNVTFLWRVSSSSTYTETTPVEVKTHTGDFHAHLTGLSSGTKYYFKAKATNTCGSSYGEEMGFTTDGPSVETKAASSISGVTATLVGSLTSIGHCSSYHVSSTDPGYDSALAAPSSTEGVDSRPPASDILSFEYGLTTSYGGTADGVPPYWSGDVPKDFTATITGLTPGATYHFRAKAIGCCSGNYSTNGTPPSSCCSSYGADMTFTTIPTPTPPEPIGTGSHGSSVGGATGTVSTTYGFNPPVSLPNLQILSASLSANTVTPGAPVTVTADIANKSAVNANKKVTLYVNGQVETTQGITVNSGGSSKLTFNVSRSEPGDYKVYVDGVPAGSFKVELFRESDGILIVSAALVAIALLLGMFLLWRRQRAGQ